MEEKKNIVIDLSQKLLQFKMAGIVLLAVAVGAFAYNQINDVPQNAPREISISGEGRALGKPDIAKVSFGVTSQELKSQDAVNRNNEIMNKVIAEVKKLGVTNEDIQTTSYNLSPWYDYTERGSVFKGYQLYQQVSVKIRNFENISAVLDVATAHGATNVGSLQFDIDDPEKIRAEARQKAIQDAKDKLAVMARQSGLRVGKLVNVSEGFTPTPIPMYAEARGGMAPDQKSVPPQIETGQQEVVVTVTLTYLVR